LYSTATMFVLCSRFDAFPNVVLEAQAAGVPVVAYREGSRPEAVCDRTTGLLVPPADTAALTDAIVSLAAQPERVSAMSQAAQRFANAHFTWEHVGRTITDTLDAVRTRKRYGAATNM
jgi:glycosyltransferase involved in cell wall biosynthesis